MTVLNFPGSPATGDLYSENGVLYQWDGEKWTANLNNQETPIISEDDLCKLKYTYPGGVERTVCDRLEDAVSVKDFGAVGDGTTDDKDAIMAAFNSGAQTVIFPESADDYYVRGKLTVPDGVSILYYSKHFIRCNPSPPDGEGGSVMGLSGNNTVYNIKIDADSVIIKTV